MTTARRIISTKFLLAGCALAAGLGGARPVFAENVSPSVNDDIVVTAQKRSENIQDVPAAVSVVSDRLLADIHATQLTDIGTYIPAVQIDSSGSPGQTTISIRGIAPIGRGSTVATYIDDSPVGSSSSYGGAIAFQLDLLPYDVQRVEVLRGPQGTLYGASSMGGLLKYVLTDPSLDHFGGQIGGDGFALANAGHLGGGVRVNFAGPIVKDTLGITASYAREDTPGFIDNSVTGQRDQNGSRQESARIGLLWKPIDTLTVKVNGIYQRATADGDANVALDTATLQPVAWSRQDNNLEAQPFRKTIKFVSGNIDYRTSFAEFISATSYSDTKTSQIQDASYTYGVAFPAFGLPLGRSAYDYELHLKKFSEELRIQSIAGSRLEWLIGGFFTDERSANFQSPSGLDISGNPIPGLNPLFAGQLPSTYREYAVFGDLTFNLTSALQIFGGLRYSHNDQVFSEFGGGPLTGTISLLDAKSSEGVTTYNGGLRYKIASDVTAYARIASGYRPGGPNLAVAGIPPTFKSDTLTNYEVGLKSQFLDHLVLLDVAAFRIDWNQIQLLSNGAGFNHIVNGGSARSQGVEATSTVKPIAGLDLDGTIAYIDSRLTEDVPDLGGKSGDCLPSIPRISGSVRATYTQRLSADWRGSIGAGVRMVGARYSDVTSAYDAYRLPGYAALDLNVSVTNGRYTARLFAKNATDRHAYLSYTPLVNQASGDVTQVEATVLQPRVIGLALDAKF